MGSEMCIRDSRTTKRLITCLVLSIMKSAEVSARTRIHNTNIVGFSTTINTSNTLPNFRNGIVFTVRGSEATDV